MSFEVSGNRLIAGGTTSFYMLLHTFGLHIQQTTLCSYLTNSAVLGSEKMLILSHIRKIDSPNSHCVTSLNIVIAAEI